MKRCTACKEPKPLTAFNVNRAKKDGRQNFCRECGKKQSRRYYKANDGRMKRQIAESKAKRADQNHTWLLQYLAEHPCVDCGEDDLLVLELDHVRGRKKMDVVKLVTTGYSLKTIKKEIAKCVVRCANCHRRKTYIDNGTTRALKVSAMLQEGS